jgi:glycosyltransferase involved in cell wall biosynthesis
MTRLLAKAGETVHVISQLWEGADKTVEELHGGRLIVHRVPFEDWRRRVIRRRPAKAINAPEAKALFESDFPPQCFAWQATLLAERLIENEAIDIVEAPEYEAPLYYLQLRRALGLGPSRHPPCVVHLHSPTELIVQHNSWDLGHPYFVAAKRLEDYTISAADALLCPSRYLARQVETQFDMSPGAVTVIPYPLGKSSRLERTAETWDKGTICYVGRLEPRKGVAEWIDAAVDIARHYPDARFEFVGTNVIDTSWLATGGALESRIPRELKDRFRFAGQQNHSSLPSFLGRARIAVVPSRWDNLPHSCLEAMGTGLPILTTPTGGMAELVEDGVNGWVSEDTSRQGLREAAMRALTTSGSELAEMGLHASIAVERHCGNGQVVRDQLAFRHAVVRLGSARSCSLPTNFPWANRSLQERRTRPFPLTLTGNGMGLVVTCDTYESAKRCFDSIRRQTQPPTVVVVVTPDSAVKGILPSGGETEDDQWRFVHVDRGDLPLARNAGFQAIERCHPKPLGVAFLDAHDELAPDYVARCTQVLHDRPDVGIVSFWTRQLGIKNRIVADACPAFPYQWLRNDAAAGCAVRVGAFQRVGGFRSMEEPEYAYWDLITAVLADGWRAVTVPETLSHRYTRSLPAPTNTRMLTSIYERFPDLLARDAVDVARLSRSGISGLLSGRGITPQEQVDLARILFRHPVHTARWAMRTLGRRIGRRMQLKA